MPLGRQRCAGHRHIGFAAHWPAWRQNRLAAEPQEPEPAFTSPFRQHPTSAVSVRDYGVAFPQAVTSGLLAALRARQEADRSVGKVAAFLALPQ